MGTILDCATQATGFVCAHVDLQTQGGFGPQPQERIGGEVVSQRKKVKVSVKPRKRRRPLTIEQVWKDAEDSLRKLERALPKASPETLRRTFTE